MKTIDLATFTSRFMEISKNLTLSEVRLLYLLITEPDVIKISQKELANITGTNRRTIWLGLEKLRQLDYITNDDSRDINITLDETEISESHNLLNNIDNSNERSYDELFYNYATKREDKYFIRMIENFPNNIPNTLDSFKFNLPQNIGDIAKKYSFEKVLNIVRISLQEIEKNKDDGDKYYNSGFISHNFKEHHSEQTKRKNIKKAIIFQPFNIQNLINKVDGNLIDEVTEFARYYSKKIYKVELEELIKMGGD